MASNVNQRGKLFSIGGGKAVWLHTKAYVRVRFDRIYLVDLTSAQLFEASIDYEVGVGIQKFRSKWKSPRAIPIGLFMYATMVTQSPATVHNTAFGLALTQEKKLHGRKKV